LPAASNSASLPGCTFSFAITVIGIVDLLEESDFNYRRIRTRAVFQGTESFERRGAADKGKREARDYRDRNRVRVARTCPRCFLPLALLASSA
jgi:hypothetical protein